MEKFIYYNNLYLIYKNLLSENNQDVFNLYYGENLSMQEIADLKNVSKSRIGSIIKNVEKKLDNYESILHINDRNQQLNSILELSDVNEIKEKIENVIKGE